MSDPSEVFVVQDEAGLPIYHYVDGKRIEGAPEAVSGDLSGVRGDLSGVRGNLDECELTAADRERGVHISQLLIAPEDAPKGSE